MNIKAADNNDFSDTDSQYLGGAIYMTDMKEKLSWRFGIMQTMAFGEIQTIPVGGVKFFEDQFDIDVMLPFKAGFTYKFNKRLSLTWLEQLEGGKYQLTDDEPWNGSILKFSNLKSSINADYRLKGPLTLSAGIGYVSHRLWELRDKDNSQLGKGSSIKDGKFFRIQLHLIPPRHEKKKGKI